MRRNGLTLIELLVAFAVVAILIAILLPAIQAARESSRRLQCRSNLSQIGLALQNYETTHRMWPAASVQRNVSWHVAILPQIGQTAIYNRIDFSADSPAVAVAHVPIPLYLCPSDGAPQVFQKAVTVAATNYLGNSGTGVLVNGYDGMFCHFVEVFPGRYKGGPVRPADVKDGLSATASVSEALHSVGGVARERLRITWNLPEQYELSELNDFLERCKSIPAVPAAAGWMGSPIAHGWRWHFGEIGYSTYNHMLPPMQPNCFNGTQVQLGIYTAASAHSNSANLLFADGHVQLFSAQVDSRVWNAIGSRNGSEVVDSF